MGNTINYLYSLTPYMHLRTYVVKVITLQTYLYTLRMYTCIPLIVLLTDVISQPEKYYVPVLC